MAVRVELIFGCLALALVSAWAAATAQSDPIDVTSFVNTISATCAHIAEKAKNIDVYDYCVAEMLRPVLKGSNCKAFVSGDSAPGYHCDAKGMLYYEPPAPMTTNQISAEFGKIMSKYTRNSIAACITANDNNEAIAACLTKEKKRLTEIFTACGEAKVNTNNDGMLLFGLDHCIQDKLKRWR